MLASYYELTEGIPSYRLGQHICNSMRISYIDVEGNDLFLVDNKKAKEMFKVLVNKYWWDVNNLPVFPEYPQFRKAL
jgi:hypothetical protein